MPAAPAPAVTPTTHTLIVCADDFAIHTGASQGIAQLAALGRISATSAMVLSPRWPADADLLRPLRGRIDVGLHLDWTSDFALALGHGLPLARALRTSVWGGFDPQAARRVVAQQLDLFELVWGAPPDFVDGHQHVQQFDGIRQALVAELAARYPARRPWLRVSAPPGWRAGLKDWGIAALGSFAFKSIAIHAGFTCARGLIGAYDFKLGEAAYAAQVGRWLARAQPMTVMMVHPAVQAPADDPIGAARQMEWGYLNSPAWPATLAVHGWRLAGSASAPQAPQPIRV